jgi:hypothetical protein
VLSPRKSLKAWFDETKQTLEMWRQRKALRVQEYEDLQFEVKALKQQMGFATAAPPGAPDITRANLELLRLERDKMINERVGAAAAAAPAAGPSILACRRSRSKHQAGTAPPRRPG